MEDVTGSLLLQSVLVPLFPQPVQDVLSKPVFGGNTVLALLVAALLFIVVFGVLFLFRYIILVRLAALKAVGNIKMIGVLIKVFQGISRPFFYSTSLFIASAPLVLPSQVEQVIFGLFLAFLVYETIRILQKVLEVSILRFWLPKAREDEQMTAIIRLLLSISLWVIGMLLLISNLGIDVTSLVASLGIGGIAVALAVQNVLGDMFSSFSIYFDEPFKIGDFIVVGDDMGVVKKIGLKTTRIQALRGEELVIPNAVLTSVRVQNFKRMQRRRIVFSIGVEYETPLEKLKRIPALLREVMIGQEKVEVDRVHFSAFGDSSLKFECVYFINSPNYTEYMDAQQAMNIGILEAFGKEGINIAFPTRTVRLIQS